MKISLFPPAGTLMMAAALSLVSSASAEPMSLRYKIKVSGATAMKMNYDGDVNAKGYRAHVTIRPSGFMSFFIKKSFELEGRGATAGKKARPRSFTMIIRKKNKGARTGVVTWKGGRFQWKRTPPLPPERARAALRAVGRGAPDPLALLIGLAMRDPAAACKGTRRVFDAHDVYDLKLSLRAGGRVSGPAYSGPTVLCRMVYVPVAGMSEKKKRRDLKNPPVFNVSLAAIRSRDAGALMVPVAVSGTMQGHKFSATLGKASLGGRPLR